MDQPNRAIKATKKIQAFKAIERNSGTINNWITTKRFAFLCEYSFEFFVCSKLNPVKLWVWDETIQSCQNMRSTANVEKHLTVCSHFLPSSYIFPEYAWIFSEPLSLHKHTQRDTFFSIHSRSHIESDREFTFGVNQKRCWNEQARLLDLRKKVVTFLTRVVSPVSSLKILSSPQRIQRKMWQREKWRTFQFSVLNRTYESSTS